MATINDYDEKLRAKVQELKELCIEMKVPMIFATHVDTPDRPKKCGSVVTTYWEEEWHVPVEFDGAVQVLQAGSAAYAAARLRAGGGGIIGLLSMLPRDMVKEMIDDIKKEGVKEDESERIH